MLKFKIIFLIFLFNLYKQEESNVCKICKKANTILVKVLRKLPKIEPFATLICSYFIFPYYNVCNKYITTFFSNFIKNESLFLENTDYICSNFLKVCDSKIVFWDFKEYVKNLYSDYDIKKIENNYKNSKTNNEYEVLIFSDMHFDPEYKEGAYEICGKPAGCCRENSEPYKGNTQKAKYWGSYEKCNGPFRLFDQALRFIKTDLKKNPKLIFLLGDDNPHCMFYLDKSNYTYNSKLISKKLLEHFDKKNNIFVPVIGNHDSLDLNQYDFTTKENNGFAEAYKDLYSDENFIKKAYYSRQIKELNLKILSLNSFVLNKFNQFLLRNPTDPLKMLEWIIKELRDSEKIGEDVIIASHFPIYSADVQNEYIKYIEPVFERFEKTIKFHLAAHTHKDDIDCIKKYSNPKECSKFTFKSPSMTSYSNINPSFRFLKIKNNNLINYDQYRLDLEKWNKFPKSNLKWDLAYEFLKEYDLKDMSNDSMNEFFDKIKNIEKYKKKQIFNHNTGRVQKEEKIEKIDDKKKNPNDFNEDKLLWIINEIIPNWYNKKN